MPVRLQTLLDYGFWPFFLLNGLFAAYVVLTVAVVVRVPGPLTGSAYPRMIDVSAAAWILAFAIFSFQCRLY